MHCIRAYVALSLVAMLSSCDRPPTSPHEARPLTLRPNEAPANIAYFELTGECTQAPGAPPWHQYKEYAQYEVHWAGLEYYEPTDSFRLYEGGGSDPWDNAVVIRKGLATAGSTWLGDWDYDTYLVQGIDWRHFWIEMFNSYGSTGPIPLNPDSVLVSAGCPDP